MRAVDLRSETFAVVDVETTGLDPRTDAVVEVACLRIERGRLVDRVVTLIDPERGIPERASAVHGIFASDVYGAPTIAHVRSRLRAATADAVVVAHNARFDLGFLPFLAKRPIICTMRLAMHLVETTSYRNEALRRLFAIEMPPGHGAHRAGSDAAVTGAVLACLLERYAQGPFTQSIDGLISTIAKPARLGRFAFGVHRGLPVAEIPTSYLRWIVATGFEAWPDVRATAEREIARRDRRSGRARAPISVRPTGARGLSDRRTPR